MMGLFDQEKAIEQFGNEKKEEGKLEGKREGKLEGRREGKLQVSCKNGFPVHLRQDKKMRTITFQTVFVGRGEICALFLSTGRNCTYIATVLRLPQY